MSDRIHVTMVLDLFVEDAEAMRQAAFERLRGAWSRDEDFPYESAADLPIDEVVHSLLADALPADIAGCRRSQLHVEVEQQSEDDSPAASESEADSESSEDDDDSDTEPRAAPGDSDE
jgi:hypothetical protein